MASATAASWPRSMMPRRIRMLLRSPVCRRWPIIEK
nr:MAG TPA: hypothetical protein [Caudoviricetes sp.]